MRTQKRRRWLHQGDRFSVFKKDGWLYLDRDNRTFNLEIDVTYAAVSVYDDVIIVATLNHSRTYSIDLFDPFSALPKVSMSPISIGMSDEVTGALPSAVAFIPIDDGCDQLIAVGTHDGHLFVRDEDTWEKHVDGGYGQAITSISYSDTREDVVVTLRDGSEWFAGVSFEEKIAHV